MVTQASPPCNWADLLPSCHRHRLRSAISVCPPLRLGGSSASRLGGRGRGREGPPSASCPAPVHTTRDVPHRVYARHRAAPSTRSRSRPVRPAAAGVAAGQPAPVARRGDVALTAVSGWPGTPARRQAQGCHRGYAETLGRRRLPSVTVAGTRRPRCAMRASRAICYGIRRGDMSRLSRSWNGSLVPWLPSVIPENVAKCVSGLQTYLSRLSESNR